MPGCVKRAGRWSNEARPTRCHRSRKIHHSRRARDAAKHVTGLRHARNGQAQLLLPRPIAAHPVLLLVVQ